MNFHIAVATIEGLTGIPFGLTLARTEMSRICAQRRHLPRGGRRSSAGRLLLSRRRRQGAAPAHGHGHGEPTIMRTATKRR